MWKLDILLYLAIDPNPHIYIISLLCIIDIITIILELAYIFSRCTGTLVSRHCSVFEAAGKRVQVNTCLWGPSLQGADAWWHAVQYLHQHIDEVLMKLATSHSTVQGLIQGGGVDRVATPSPSCILIALFLCLYRYNGVIWSCLYCILHYTSQASAAFGCACYGRPQRAQCVEMCITMDDDAHYAELFSIEYPSQRAQCYRCVSLWMMDARSELFLECYGEGTFLIY